MKTLLRIVGGISFVLVFALLGARITGFNPKGPRAGLWLSGSLVTSPVNDWSFVDNYPTIEVQTNTWYLIPHSVTIWCVSYEKNLYLQAFGRTWKQNVARDPHVRIKIGNQLYDETVTPITDTSEFSGVAQNMTKKYPSWKPLKPSEIDLGIFLRIANN
jgi:hypothetical protein